MDTPSLPAAGSFRLDEFFDVILEETHMKKRTNCLKGAALGIALLAVPGAGFAAIWTVGPSGANFTTIQLAIANASVANGDTLQVAAGTYANTVTSMTINKQLTIVGAGMGQTIITHTTAPGTDTSTVIITAANVTLRDLTIAYGNGEGPTIYRGSGATTTVANTTFENVHFDINYARRGIFVNNNSTNTVIRGCVFEGYMNREVIDINNNTIGSPGTMIIEDNVFAQSHYQQGSILFDGASGQNLVIRRNFFISRVGVYDAGGLLPASDPNYGFQSDGTLLYNISVGTLTAGRTAEISHNTFVFQDSSTTNQGGRVPQMRGINASTTANYTASPLTIRDNIFTGYKAEPPPAGPAHTWQAGGVFGGAIELDGINSFGEIVANAALNVGAKGTMSIWVKLDNIGKRNQILEGPGNDTGLEFQYRNNTSGQFYMRPYGGSEFVIPSGSQGTTSWKLVQYTWDQGTAIARVYTGDQATAVSESTYLVANDQNISGWTTPTDTTSGVFTFGNDPGDSSRLFDGQIDDMILFNNVLAPAELESLRTGGGSAFSADSRLVAFWPFNETTGSTASSTVNSLNIEMKDIRSSAVAFAVVGNATATVNNNLYFDNAAMFLNGVTDAAAVLGDPLFAGTGADTVAIYTPDVDNSPAVGAASDGHTIGAVSFQPSIDVNAGLTVVQNATAAITTGRLNTTDPEQGPAGLTYTVTTPTTIGTLSLLTFTQLDIDNGNVTYTNTLAGTTDSFAFSVSDGYTEAVTGTFSISVITSLTDTDRDGLPNDLETILGTLPGNRDSDGDGVEDGVEVAIGTNPNSNLDPLVANRVDTDADLIPDFYDPQPANPDFDNDGVRDGFEYAYNQAATLTGRPPIGDANTSGIVNVSDAINILEDFLGLAPTLATDENTDINRNGSTDALDATFLYQEIQGNIPFIPFP